ncbi:olfactomedin-like protein 2B [Pholidichthys leucotaenia]
MWPKVSLLVLCCAISRLEALEVDRSTDPSPVKALLVEPQEEVPSAGKVGDRQRGGELHAAQRDSAPAVREEGRVLQPTSEPLEDELDNQENVISQLLGDYDKVKTLSSGSDCICRCIVRPIKRADCSHIYNGDSASLSQDFYTVETITKGTDCKKCVCMAPASAVNPCEGEYRFKKLQEASKDNVKLATVIDLLEGSLYGMDLLKLNSITTKLLTRLDNLEKAFAQNFTERVREKERAKERAKEKDKEKKAQQRKKKTNDLDRPGVKSGAGAYANKQKNDESQLKKNQQQDGLLEQQQLTKNKTATQKSVKEKTGPRQPVKDKKSIVVKGVKFYKAEEESYQEETEKGRGRNNTLITKDSVDLLISDQLPPTRTFLTKSSGHLSTVTREPNKDPSTTLSSAAPTHQPSLLPKTTQRTTTTAKPTPSTIKASTQTTTTATTTKPTTIKLETTSHQTTTTRPIIQPSTPATQQTTAPSDTNISPPIHASPTVASQPRSKSRLTWTENPADQPKTTKKPGVCKDTVATISEPVQQNSYGLSDGAWMRDARGHGSVIYLTSGHLGNILLEFRDMENFKLGHVSNSYKLPYRFSGTGHVVFNGAFYYNRAFSRDVIRYDLRHRYVAAWTTLHDALLEDQPQTAQTEVEFAVDESGLWLLYPALDTEGFHQEVMLLVHLHPRDLQPKRSFRTGLRRGRYGNSFLVCGVLYAVDSMERRFANVTYAFDTYTLTHTVPSLAFTNLHKHNSQLSYCPLDKKLYSWDDGHQMMYDIIFAY